MDSDERGADREKENVVNWKRSNELESAVPQDNRSSAPTVTDAWCARVTSESRLDTPPICDECGGAGHVEGHFPDNFRPYQYRVSWFCVECHGLRHQLSRAYPPWPSTGKDTEREALTGLLANR